MAANTLLFSSIYDANTGYGFAAVLVQGANAVFQITANSTGGNSFIGNPAAADFILGATITDMFFSHDTGASAILRGANTILTLSGVGEFTAAKGWKGLQLYSGAATLTVNVPNANASVVLYLKKVYR